MCLDGRRKFEVCVASSRKRSAMEIEMTYEETVATINNIRRFGKRSGAETTAYMLEKLEHPERGIRMIHIAGTNGKGSVSAFLCEILKQAGVKAGMFTSPHLVDFEERIRVNGEMMPKADVARIGGMLLEQEFTAEDGTRVYPTMFDYCLAMALLYFREQNCEAMVIETGMGGRLDSTNAIGVPEVTVITKIGYDHMAVLGNTLEEIAAEKAGIIKRGTKLVAESQRPEVLAVLLAAAEKAGAASCEVVEPCEIRDTGFDGKGQTFSYGKYQDLSMRMLGKHQYENAVAAILAAEAYFAEKTVDGKDGLPAGEEYWERVQRDIRRGISAAYWQGRMEILRKEPFLLVDGAHNSNGVEALRASLEEMFPGETFHFIMGVMADKDYEEMVENLLPLAVDFTTVTVESDRALQAEELASCIRRKGVPAQCATLSDCLFSAQEGSGEKQIAFGSLYFIGEIEALLKKLQNDVKNA